MNNHFDKLLLKELVLRVMSSFGPDFSELYPKMRPIRSRKHADEYMKALPLIRNAVALGLAKNAEMGLAEGLYKNSIANLVQLSRQTQTNQNEWLNAARQIVDRFRKLFDRALIEQLTTKPPSEIPSDLLDSYILGEKRTAFKIFSVLHSSMKALQNAVGGIVTKSAVADAMNIVRGVLPNAWDRIYPDGPEDPFNFLQRVATNSKYILQSSK